MQKQQMNYTGSFQSRIRLICVSTVMLVCVHSTQAQTPPVGGPGGGEFIARCPPGQVLGGVQLRVGEWIDAIRPMCRTVSMEVERTEIWPGDRRYEPGPTRYDEIVTYPVSENTPAADWNGGTGGHIQPVSCNIGQRYLKGETEAQHYDRFRASGKAERIDRRVVSGIYVEAEGENTVTVDRITLRCDDFEDGEFYKEPEGGFRQPDPVPEKDFGRDARTFWIDDDNDSPTFEGRHRTGASNEVKGMSLCPVRQNGAPTVAVGIHGRAGKWLDALGLICEHPAKPPTPIKALGRVKLDGTNAPEGPPRAICDIAREAVARNSPAARGLKERCRLAGAAGESVPVRAVGRVKLDPTNTPPSAPRAVCDVARQARARNSPAAPGLEAQCRAAGAAGEIAPVRAVGRVKLDPTNTPPGPPREVCDVAREARARNSPAAPGLEAKCQADLAAKAAAIPPAEPIVAAVPTITANPNPVIVPNGQDAGTTMITWTAAPDYAYSEIYLSVDDGEWSEFAKGGDSSKPTTIKPGTTQTFRMMVYQGQAGTPKIIATLTVTARN